MAGHEDAGVVIARWEHEAHTDAVAKARHELCGFARLHGMDEHGWRDVAVAVSEAVTNAVRHAYADGSAGCVVVDAATDGAHLSVRVADGGTGGAGTRFGLGLPLMSTLVERVEMGPGRDGVGTVVLMEFAMRAPAPADRVAARLAAPDPVPAA